MSDGIEFYSVKIRKKVMVPKENIKKTTFERTNKDGSKQVRYGLRAEHEGSKLTKFVSKDLWDSLDVPVI